MTRRPDSAERVEDLYGPSGANDLQRILAGKSAEEQRALLEREIRMLEDGAAFYVAAAARLRAELHDEPAGRRLRVVRGGRP